MKQDFKKRLGDLLEKIDSKVLETKLSHAIELIKTGNHEEIVNKINTLDKNELLLKLEELNKMPPQEIDALRSKIGANIKKEDVEQVSDKLSPEGKKMLEKIISTLKIK